jgi:hypothetical protein
MTFCPHESAAPLASSTVEMTDPDGAITCHTCWQRFKNLGELAGDLSNQVKALEAANRLAQVVHVLSYQADPQTGELALIMDGQLIPLRGPETEEACAIEWRELMAKQAREEAEILADRIGL